jgi:predicted RNA-binding protein with PUA-like domain
MKTEPETYSIDDLEQEGETNWNGVRNFQARNFLKQCKLKDLVFIYHSGKNPQIVGLGEISKEFFLDPDPKKNGDWVQVKVKFKEKFLNPVPLKVLKQENRLKNLLLLKQSRLSVMPIKENEAEVIFELAKIKN